jgi:cytochrome c oxidase subunit III
MATHALALDDAAYTEQRDIRLLGFLFFLISDSIFFGSLIFAYLYLRNSVGTWPPPGVERPDVYLAALNSIVLFGSGVTMHFATDALKHGARSRFVSFMLPTIALGTLFVLGQVYEYVHILPVTKYTATTFGATFYTLTGMHGFHVSVGVVFLITVLIQTLRGTYTTQRHFGLTAATLYWHFVDIIWVALFFLFYIL